MAVKNMGTELAGKIKTPEQLAADQSAVDASTAARQQSRQDGLIERRGERETAADRARLDRETEIERLRRRQAELAAEGASAAGYQQVSNQLALAQAIAAAKAAREAADAGRLKEEDFAVSTKTESVTRFSGEALAMSVGRSDDPQKRIAKLAEDQVKRLDKIAEVLDDNLAEIMRLQGLGGFA
jgi:hypothetical protein